MGVPMTLSPLVQMLSCRDCHSLYPSNKRCLCETPLQRLVGSFRAFLGRSAR